MAPPLQPPRGAATQGAGQLMRRARIRTTSPRANLMSCDVIVIRRLVSSNSIVSAIFAGFQCIALASITHRLVEKKAKSLKLQ